MGNEILELINQGIIQWDGNLLYLPEIINIIKSYNFDIKKLNNGNQLVTMRDPVNLYGYDGDKIRMELNDQTVVSIYVRFRQKKEFDEFVLSLFNSDKAQFAFYEEQQGPIAIFKYRTIMIQVGPEKYSVQYFFHI